VNKRTLTTTKFATTIGKLVTVKPAEIKALLISCLYFYLLLCAYYIIRPIRDEMVIANGVNNIQWLLLLTLIALLAISPIFGWITSRFRTRQFLSYCSLFFASNLILFFFAFNVAERATWITQGFFIWVNVFNMFIVSLFWSFMNDVFNQEQVKRLFAFIAAGGTAGALTGPIITTSLVENIGLSYLLLISAGILASTVLTINWLASWENSAFTASNSSSTHRVKNEKLKGGTWNAFSSIFKSRYLLCICAFILLYAASITFVQIRQAELIESAYSDPIQRTKLFSTIDFAVNGITLVFQLFLTSRLINWIGYRAALMLVPIGITFGFALMASMPLLAVMIGIEVFRRSGDYAIMKPVREMLFSIVSREQKYKAKNFIDTAVLRTGNISSAWLYAGIKGLGVSTAAIGSISIALGVAWCAIAYWLGGQFKHKEQNTE